MSQKTLFKQTALAVAVAIVSTSAPVSGLPVKRIFLPLALAVRIPGKVRLPMTQATRAVTRR